MSNFISKTVNFIKYFFIICLILGGIGAISSIKGNSKEHVILITIDGVRWQDMLNACDGHCKSLDVIPVTSHFFIDRGSTIGKESPVVLSGPNHISQPGYLEIISGRPRLDCQSNFCPQNTENTVLNDFYYGENIAVFAGWNTIANTFSPNYMTSDNSYINIGREIRSSAWRQLRIEDNNTYDSEFSDDYRPDRFTIQAVKSYLGTAPQPTFMWISLGDTDEHAHQNNFDQYIQDLKDFDQFMSWLLLNTSVHTKYVITTDHGRSNNFTDHGTEPESRRTWIMMYGENVPANGHMKFDRDVTVSEIRESLTCPFNIYEDCKLVSSKPKASR